MAQATNKSRRRWRIDPDEYFSNTDIPHVSDDALAQGLLKGVAIVQAMGGKLVLHPERRPTDMLPGEAITTGAVVEWIPHLNAPLEDEPTVRFEEKQEPVDLPDDDELFGPGDPADDIAEGEELKPVGVD